MADLIEQFRIFLKSSFSLESRNELFESIWRQYYQRILVFVKIMVKNKDSTADDISQEVMLKVYENLNRYSPVYSFTTWIYAIARNHCLDYLKSKKIHTENFSYLPDTDSLPQSDMASEQDGRIESDELHSFVNTYTNSLKSTDRQITFLHFYENLSYKKISGITEIPVGTIKYRVHVIRKGLRTYLEKCYGE